MSNIDFNLINVCPVCGSEAASHWIEDARGGDMCEFDITWGVECRECGEVSYVDAHYMTDQPFSAELIDR